MTDLTKKDQVISTSIESEMQTSYLEYAMSVIVSRALPDCRDGLKPVHRKILYAMYESKNHHNKPYKKSARVVGDVMGKYHPHGDSPIYQSIVRMAQSFSLNRTLIDGQGNFGSIDGDEAAHFRYTEIRLESLSDIGIFSDIKYATVDFQNNYDNSLIEPKVLPVRFPNLLINGTNGIAVGMATNIPTHNLSEVMEACCAYVDNPEITIEEIIDNYIPAPDFPLGGRIIGIARTKKAMISGRGSIIVRAVYHIEESKSKNSIVITEIPYQVNKSEIVKNIEHLSKEKIIEGITEIRDESNKLGIRIVIELKKDAYHEIIIKQLYKYTQLENSFSLNMLALHNGKPIVMNALNIISTFVKFREDVILRRTNFIMNKALGQAHILIGLLICIDNIDKIVNIIKTSKDIQQAKTRLLNEEWISELAINSIKKIEIENNKQKDKEYIKLSEEQCKAILEMKLSKLTGLESGKIISELDELIKEISEYFSILESREKLMSIVKKEFIEIKEKFGYQRRSILENSENDIEEEDLIPNEDAVVTISRTGYIKRVPLTNYREQKRGGKGKIAMNTYNDDVVTDVIVTKAHNNLLFFSNLGKVYRLKTYKIPLSNQQSKGRAIINLINLQQDEKINTVLSMSNDTLEWNKNNPNNKYFLCFATSKGEIKRNEIEEFSNIPTNGKIALRLDEDDFLIGVNMGQENDYVMLASKLGRAIKFPLSRIRVFKGRLSYGIKGISLNKEDRVVSMCILYGTHINQKIRDMYLSIPSQRRIEFISNALEIQNINNNQEKTELLSQQEDLKVLASNLIKEFQSTIDKYKLNYKEDIIAEINDIKTDIENDEFDQQDQNQNNNNDSNEEISQEKDLTAEKFIELALKEQFILTISSQGYGKRTSSYEYRLTARGGFGVQNMNIESKNSYIISSFPVENKDSIVVICSSGKLIRIQIESVRMTSRNTVGVKIIDLESTDNVQSVCKIIE